MNHAKPPLESKSDNMDLEMNIKIPLLLLIDVVNHQAMTDVTAWSDKETAKKIKANLSLLIHVQLVIIKWS